MTPRSGRASMREGPLSNLFRSTEAPRTTAGTEQLFAPTDDMPAANLNSYVAVIRVVGVGGAGCNAINRMVEAGIRGVEFIAVNTDRQALDACDADVRIPVGLELTQGRGTGGDPEKGEQAIRDSEEALRRALKGSDLVFIAAGEGGGMGSGGRADGGADRARARGADGRGRHQAVPVRGQAPDDRGRRRASCGCTRPPTP